MLRRRPAQVGGGAAEHTQRCSAPRARLHTASNQAVAGRWQNRVGKGGGGLCPQCRPCGGGAGPTFMPAAAAAAAAAAAGPSWRRSEDLVRPTCSRPAARARDTAGAEVVAREEAEVRRLALISSCSGCRRASTSSKSGLHPQPPRALATCQLGEPLPPPVP